MANDPVTSDVQKVIDSSLPTAPMTPVDPLGASEEKKRLEAERSSMVQKDDKRRQVLDTIVLGGAKLADVLDDDNMPLETKEQALKEAAQRESQNSVAQNADKVAAYKKWAKEVETANNINKANNELGTGKKVQVPTPDTAGLSTSDVVEIQKLLTDPNVQAENEQRAADAALKAQKAAQAEAARKEQEAQALGAQKAIVEQNRLDGFMAKQNQISNEMQSAYRRQMDLIDTEQNALSEIDPDRFWNNRSTSQKILGAISIGLGAVGGALTKTGGNSALDIINKAIDNDINAQKVNNEQKLALKQNALKRAGLEIERLAQLSKDQERKMQMQAAADQLKQQQLQIADERANKMALTQRLYSTGVTPEEADAFLDPKQEGRKISMPDGNITLAVSPNAGAKYNEAIGALVSARELTDSVATQVSSYGKLDAANPFGDKKSTLDGSIQALIGALRIPITGPGVLNEQEYQRIMGKVLGDPASFFTVGSVATAKIKGLQNTLKMIERANLEAATGKKWETNEDRLRKRLLREGTELDKMEEYVEAAKKNNPDTYNK